VNKPRKILVYIDGTEESITAAQYAICLASFFGAELIALYVVNIEEMEYERDMESDAERYLNHVNQLAVQKGMSIIRKSLRGSVNKEIVDTVKAEDVDLLVIGELARIRSRRDEFYDEAERAMRTVPCSVVIVKDEDKVWEMYQSLV
jgi:nucleotide-binding universal stress UspA family protein